LAKTFSEISSNNNYSKVFLKHKSEAEKQKVNFTSHNDEVYNMPITYGELTESIKNSKDGSPGPDGICSQFLKHLPVASLELLLNIFNFIWTTDYFPSIWQQAIVVPIPKSKKDQTDPNNYRPISLTCILGKVFEKIVNNRLTTFLEQQEISIPEQSGFRKGRSTLDHLVRLESIIREGF